MARMFVCLVLCTVVTASLSTAIADERQPLSMTTVAPETPPTLTQVNDGTYEFSIQLKNMGSDTIVLWPYLSVKIMDSDGEEVPNTTRIGRWGFIRSPSVLEEIPFVTLDAGQAHDINVNLIRYTYDNKFRLGESIEGIFRVETDTPLNCRSIRARLVGIENSQAHGHADRYTHQCDAVEVATPGVFSGSYKQDFSLSAEAEGPLTAKGKLFSIEWFVQVELDVPWAEDPKIRAPVVLLPR